MDRAQPATRDTGLQRLIDLIDQNLLARPRSNKTFQASRKVFGALTGNVGPSPRVVPQRLDICSELVTALNESEDAALPMPALASAFAAVEPRLNWTRRATAEPADSWFYNTPVTFKRPY